MSLPWRIAARYLFGAKSHHAINAITLVAACGVAVITTALICALSVYNGFEELVGRLCSNFDPELRIEAAEGKHLADPLRVARVLSAQPEVLTYDATLEETVLLSYNGRQIPAMLKGVDDRFREVSHIDSILRSGTYTLQDPVADYTVMGVGLAAQLGIGAGFLRPFTVYSPRREGKISLLNPDDAFTEGFLFCSGTFAVEQVEYDDHVLITNLAFARRLLADTTLTDTLTTDSIRTASGLTTAYEVRLTDGARVEKVKSQLSAALGADYRLLTRMEQQADSYKIMQIEKWITFLIILFILLIASFNVIGALSMLIIDKEAETRILYTLGADRTLVRRVFVLEGLLISGSGAVVGLVLGVVLCLLQEHYGLISLGNGSDMFIIDSYPVSLHVTDILATALCVFVIGLLATLYPLRVLKRQEGR
jgi:ABC-type lipoprotein release transport system permease subunit